MADKEVYKLNDYLELTENEQLMLALLVTYPKLTNVELSELLGVSTITIGKWRHKPAFEKALKQKQLGVIDFIESQKKELAEHTVQLALRAKNEMVQFQACKFLLNNDINGVGNTEGDDSFELEGWDSIDENNS